MIESIEVFSHPTSYQYENAIDNGFLIYTVHYSNGTHEEFHLSDFSSTIPKYIQDFLAKTDLFAKHTLVSDIDFPDLGIYTQSRWTEYSIAPF